MIRVLLVVLLGLGLLLGVPVAHAFGTTIGAQIIVTTTADVLEDDGFCSLREAIQVANLDAPSGTMAGECVAGMGDDTIILGDGIYEIQIEGTNEDQNLTGDFDIHRSLIIVGQDNTIITGNHLDRVFHIFEGIVSLQHLTIQDGVAPNGAKGVDGAEGGGIYNLGTLSLNSVVLQENRSGDGGRELYYGNGGGDGGGGGGIYNAGTLILKDVTIRDNQAGHGEIGYRGGTGGRGGGIYNAGNLTVLNSLVANNRAGAGGSASYGHPGIGGNGGEAGGIFAAESSHAQIQQSQIKGNIAGNGASAPVCETSSMCMGPNRAGNGGGGGGVAALGVVSITNTIILDNRSGDAGEDTTPHSSGGHGGSGGGINQYSVGEVTINYTTIVGNTAGNARGRYSSFGVGGGIAGGFTITSSIIAKNLIYEVYGTINSDCAEKFSFLGRSIVGTRGCIAVHSTGLIIEGFDPQLGSIGQVLPGSIAIDAGNCPDTDIDYWGDPRRIDDPFMPNFADACDIGADEWVSPLLQVGPIPIQVTEGGSADLFALVLTQRPSADVTITFTNSQVFVGPQTVRFTPENWSMQQAVGVLAIDNEDIDFTRIDYIDMQVESTDPRYNNLAVADLAVEIRDNDAPMLYLPTVTGRH